MSSLYLVIDMINDLLVSDPLRSEAESRGILPKTAIALERARAAGVAIGYVRVGFTGDFGEAPKASPLFNSFKGSGLLNLGGWGTAVHDALAPAAGDLDIVKHAVSPFHGTILGREIEARGITKLFLSGISTGLAVSGGVREAHDRGLAVVMIEDCCAAFSADEHHAEVQVLSPLCIVSTHDKVDFGANA